jgi:hypothetical protein
LRYSLIILNAHGHDPVPESRSAVEPKAADVEEHQKGTNRFFAPNIDHRGRILRGGIGAALLIGAAFSIGDSKWLGLLLAIAGCFALFEAQRGWCAARACGIKTRL